ncbi:TSUP family transporter [Pantoea sp. Tr-811]|uniref:TSUP family transporter n=1 Tax=Pantoea sp. Tr-811 TaxID=2608361 RepID=UPI0019631FDD|nr:TSUP family transporter [Pantoea sp. Tr-811]NIF27840.1 TSUP family transporter [Pantoea sp. Tr-811]
MEIELSTLLILATIALLAGFFDAIAGGGGLLTLPALLVAGIDPLASMATNKLQASSATVSAVWAFARKGMIRWRTDWPMATLSYAGGVAGALSISLLDRAILEVAAPVLLIAVAAYFALSPKLGEAERRQRVSTLCFTLMVAPLIGFYDGLFGPGTGSFFMVAFTLLLGRQLMQAICSSKLLNAACNLGALTVFVFAGAIIWPLALAMAVCAIVGAQLGACCALLFGPRLIKPLLITVCSLMALKLLLSDGHPIGGWLSQLWQ